MIPLRQLLCLNALLTLALSVSLVQPAKAASGGMQLEGVNISGAEWGSNVPGSFMVDYIFPTNTEIDYFSSKGMKIIRVPIMWERLQPNANGPLDQAYAGHLDSVVSYATSKGLKVIVDLHNYGAYHNTTVGVPGGVDNSVLANIWSQLAAKYKANSLVVFGLMNEPVGGSMTASTWLVSAQTALNAIRQTGVTNLVLVPSTYWMHAVNFVDLNASVMLNVTDPANNFSYEVHQYLDSDGSGSHTDVQSVSAAVADFNTFTAWLKQNNRTAFLGEIGVPSSTAGLDDLDAILKYLHANPQQWDGYTYWSAAAWLGL